MSEVIMMDAPGIVTYRTDIAGWVANDGTFWGKSEQDARYRSCTHRPCQDCGEPVAKHSVLCRACYAARKRAAYLAMPEVPYASDMVVCVYGTEDYCFSQEDVELWADCRGVPVETVELIVCEPHVMHEIDPDEYYSDILPEDQYVDDIDPEISDAFAKLNELIRTKKPVMSWTPGNQRTRLDPAATEALK